MFNHSFSLLLAFLSGMCAGLCSGLGILALLAALNLPAVVVFPVSQGTALVGGVALSALFFREHLNRPKIIGVCLGVCVLILAAIR